MKLKDYDDKDLVIVAVFCLCMVSLFQVPADAVELLKYGMVGMFGIVTGRNLGK